MHLGHFPLSRPNIQHQLRPGYTCIQHHLHHVCAASTAAAAHTAKSMGISRRQSTSSMLVVQGHRHPQQLWGIRPDEIRILKKEDGSDWVLGSGGFGSVYKASMNDVDIVAVKVRQLEPLAFSAAAGCASWSAANWNLWQVLGLASFDLLDMPACLPACCAALHASCAWVHRYEVGVPY